MRYSSVFISILFLISSPHPAWPRSLDAGIAFTDAETMRALETSGFSLGALLSPDWRRGAKTPVMNNAELAKVAPLEDLRATARAEFKTYEDGYLERFPGVDVGTGTRPTHRKFERNYLVSKAARFDLVGVVNRMDRAFRTPETCGEIRLIYRLAYKIKTKDDPGNEFTESRLPMSLNLVLRAKNAGSEVSCAEIAKRWLAAGDLALKGGQLAERLAAEEGPLAFIDPSQIDRMETNIQVIRVPSTIVPQFGGHAEYLLNVFTWNPGSRTFSRKRLENQVDRKALIDDPALLAELKAWLFKPETMKELDDGTLTIPEKYLAWQAISTAPGGGSRSANRPFLGLVSDTEAKAALDAMGETAKSLRNISSPFGLQQRLNDISCAGCHQSRAIGGFHFMGADWSSTIKELPQNAIFVAGSPHFYGDAPRRRAIVEAVAAGTQPDYGRGFSLRPRLSMARELTDRVSGLLNGWGAACYNGPGDKSFSAWTCGPGLACKTLHASKHEPGLGICVTRITSTADLKIGDPLQFGQVLSAPSGKYNFKESYILKTDLLRTRPNRATQPGGFFGGMYKVEHCNRLPKEAVCSPEAGIGFSKCVGELKGGRRSFRVCLKSNTHDSALRGCDVENPCRDDYLCLATDKTPLTRRGACLPPYFLFQFRVDGHPAPPEGEAPPP